MSTEHETPMTRLDGTLSDVFQTPAIISDSQIIDIEPTTTVATDHQVEADHQFVRSNMYNLLRDGEAAFQYALEIAKSSENPRAFEVVGAIMKNLADMNGQLLDMHAKKQIAIGKAPAAEPSKVVNNSIVFSGSTAELSMMIRNMQKEQ